MGCGYGPSPEQVIDEAIESKEQSLTDPRGVTYLDHLWPLIADQDDLKLVLRTDDEVFVDVPVRVWWRHGRHHYAHPDAPESSQLAIDIPDAVLSAVQSRHAKEVFGRLFGSNLTPDRIEPIRSARDAERKPDSHGYNPDFTVEVVEGDWAKLKHAIYVTSQSWGGPIGGRSLSLGGYSFCQGFAKVVEDRLEVNIANAIPDMINLWKVAFRKSIGATDRSWH